MCRQKKNCNPWDFAVYAVLRQWFVMPVAILCYFDGFAEGKL